MDAQSQHIIKILDLARMVEIATAKFYDACADCCSESADFWRGIAREECDHARCILSIMELVTAKPEQFSLKSGVNETAICEFLHEIESETQNVVSKTRDPKTLSFIAADFELAIVERHFYDLLESENVEYDEIVRFITAATIQHRIKIQEHDWTPDVH